MKRLLLFLFAALLVPATGYGQQTVLQGGSYSAGRVPYYITAGSGSQPTVAQGAPASGGTSSISEMSLIARGTGTAPYTGQGTGYLGSTFCLYDGPTSGAYHQLCLSPSATGGFGMLSYNAFNGASNQDLKFVINGTSYSFPFSDGFVVGPGSSTVGHLACWNNTAGTLLSDCGTQLAIGGSSGQIQYNNAGALGGFTVSGDGTLNTGTGALTISKIGNVSVSLGGTLTTGGAVTFSGAFTTTFTVGANTSVTLPTTGTLATIGGSEALTNKTYNGNTWTAGSGTLTVGNGKTLTASNTVTFTATDGSTLAIGTGGTLGTAAYTASTAYMPSGVQLTNSLSGNVALNNTANYFDGPSVAQGSSGTWFASGTVTLTSSNQDAMFCKLWDGTTAFASGSTTNLTSLHVTMSLSGYIASPAGNIRISCRDSSNTTGSILFNASGNSKDSTISVFRVQ